MAVFILDERCVILAHRDLSILRSLCFSQLNFFLTYPNATRYIRDQCCHLQGDGAPLAVAYICQFFRVCFCLNSEDAGMSLHWKSNSSRFAVEVK